MKFAWALTLARQRRRLEEQAETPPGRPAPQQTPTLRQGLERKPSQAWATKMLTLTMANNAVTISIITTVLYAPRKRNGIAGRTVKRTQSTATVSPHD
jgi:hypothetical protein